MGDDCVWMPLNIWRIRFALTHGITFSYPPITACSLALCWNGGGSENGSDEIAPSTINKSIKCACYKSFNCNPSRHPVECSDSSSSMWITYLHGWFIMEFTSTGCCWCRARIKSISLHRPERRRRRAMMFMLISEKIIVVFNGINWLAQILLPRLLALEVSVSWFEVQRVWDMHRPTAEVMDFCVAHF
jgi:hypothetical protein